MPMMRTVSSSCRLLSASTSERWRRGESNAREAMSGRLSWGKSGSCLGFFSMSPGEVTSSMGGSEDPAGGRELDSVH